MSDKYQFLIEDLAIKFPIKDIAKFSSLFEYLKQKKIQNIRPNDFFNILEQVSELQANRSYYAFRVEDSWSHENSGQGYGINLYCRYGNVLEHTLTNYDFQTPPQNKDVLGCLIELNISQIYTGPIPVTGDFLGIKYEEFEPHDEHSIIQDQLEYNEIVFFEQNKIKVITLEKLL